MPKAWQGTHNLSAGHMFDMPASMYKYGSMNMLQKFALLSEG